MNKKIALLSVLSLSVFTNAHAGLDTASKVKEHLLRLNDKKLFDYVAVQGGNSLGCSVKAFNGGNLEFEYKSSANATPKRYFRSKQLAYQLQPIYAQLAQPLATPKTGQQLEPIRLSINDAVIAERRPFHAISSFSRVIAQIRQDITDNICAINMTDFNSYTSASLSSIKSDNVSFISINGQYYCQIAQISKKYFNNSTCKWESKPRTFPLSTSICKLALRSVDAKTRKDGTAPTNTLADNGSPSTGGGTLASGPSLNLAASMPNLRVLPIDSFEAVEIQNEIKDSALIQKGEFSVQQDAALLAITDIPKQAIANWHQELYQAVLDFDPTKATAIDPIRDEVINQIHLADVAIQNGYLDYPADIKPKILAIKNALNFASINFANFQALELPAASVVEETHNVNFVKGFPRIKFNNCALRSYREEIDSSIKIFD